MNAYERLAQALEPAGIQASSMFGMPTLKLGKKPICGKWGDAVNFKLVPGSEPYKLALSLKDSAVFAPTMKNGRVMTMKNWIVVPFEHEEHFIELAEASINMVENESQ
jgi:hypothetical protein